MRIVFCDDDKQQLNLLLEYVQAYFAQRGMATAEYGVYTGGQSLLNRESAVDLAFLDVEMPGLSGVEVAGELKQRNPRVLIFFVTSHVEYLDDAMRLQSFRYVVKPVDRQRLFANLDDAMEAYYIDGKRVAIAHEETVSVVSARDIVCVEGAGHYTTVYTVDGIYHSKERFSYWEKTLNLPDFFKTHRSYLVNMRYVSRFTPTEVLLRSGNLTVRAKLARLRYGKFTDRYFPYLERMI